MKSPLKHYIGWQLAALAGALAFVSLSASPLQAAPEKTTETKGLLLRARSRLLGNYDILLSKQGIRLDVPTRQLVFLLTPPLWNVRYINLGRRLYSESPAASWTNPIVGTASMFRPGDPSALKSVGSQAAKLDGLVCVKHTLKLPPGTNSDGGKAWQQLLIKEGVLYCIADPYYPNFVGKALARTVGSIPVDGIPLEMTCLSNRNKEEEEIKLDSHKEVMVKASQMQVPEGFKLVPKPNDVSNAGVTDEDFANFIR